MATTIVAEVHECIRCQHELSDDVEGRDQNSRSRIFYGQATIHYFDIRFFSQGDRVQNLNSRKCLNCKCLMLKNLAKQLIWRQLLLLLVVVIFVEENGKLLKLYRTESTFKILVLIS